MTMLNSAPGFSFTPRTIRSGFARILARVARLINNAVAALIAHRERQASLFILRNLNDRELKDIGLYRGQIDVAFEEAAKARLQMQKSERSRSSEG